MKNSLKIAALLVFAITANAQTQKTAPAKTTKPATAASAPAAAPAAKKQSLHDQYSGQGYGLAGCGLGSIVFGAKPGMVQIAAATTNNYAGQSFAITTGTSNCDIPKMGQAAAVYIEANREVVMKDAARGQGETLSDLALIYNCSNTQAFSEKVQSNYQHIFESSNAYESSRAILNVIQADTSLTASCAHAG